MVRIPDDQIERLKQEVSLQRLAEAMGIILKRHGADLLGLCPFHDDHEPSLVVSSKNNLWHCLRACQAGGSVIDWDSLERSLIARDQVDDCKIPSRLKLKRLIAALLFLRRRTHSRQGGSHSLFRLKPGPKLRRQSTADARDAAAKSKAEPG